MMVNSSISRVPFSTLVFWYVVLLSFSQNGFIVTDIHKKCFEPRFIWRDNEVVILTVKPVQKNIEIGSHKYTFD